MGDLTVTPESETRTLRRILKSEFASFIQECNEAELGLSRDAWQNKAKEKGLVIPSDWLTKHLTQLQTRQRQQRQAKVRHVPRKSPSARWYIMTMQEGSTIFCLIFIRLFS